MMRCAGVLGLLLSAPHVLARATKTAIEKVVKSDDEWRRILSPEQYRVLRKEGTERPFSSPLNKEYG
ncbi:MAG: peptide-methionine (R)-S-oxide reductase, partial [Nitrospiria bacterium]